MTRRRKKPVYKLDSNYPDIIQEIIQAAKNDATIFIIDDQGQLVEIKVSYDDIQDCYLLEIVSIGKGRKGISVYLRSTTGRVFVYGIGDIITTDLDHIKSA